MEVDEIGGQATFNEPASPTPADNAAEAAATAAMAPGVLGGTQSSLPMKVKVKKVRCVKGL